LPHASHTPELNLYEQPLRVATTATEYSVMSVDEALHARSCLSARTCLTVFNYGRENSLPFVTEADMSSDIVRFKFTIRAHIYTFLAEICLYLNTKETDCEITFRKGQEEASINRVLIHVLKPVASSFAGVS
jgi:hypothetical protein